MDLLLSLKFGLGSIGSAVSSWLLNLDGTNWAELSEPKELNVGDKVPVEFSTTSSGRLNALLGSDVLPEMYVQFSSIDQAFLQGCTLSIDGTVIAHGDSIAAYLDGQKHTAIATLTDTRNISLVGQNGAGNAGFIGVIYSPALEDIDTPANSISWNLDSGPPVYDVVDDEKVINGEFDTDTSGWVGNNSNATLVWNSGKANFSNIADWAYVRATPSLNLPADIYVVSFDLSNASFGVNFHIGLGISGNYVDGNGRYEYTYSHAGGAIEFQIRPQTSGFNSCTIDNISVKPYINTISDGTIYQESEEHGTEADIMRADDWIHGSGITSAGKTVSYSGSQGDYKRAYINSQNTYIGLHVVTFKVFDETVGTVRVEMGSSSSGFKASGVYTEIFNSLNPSSFSTQNAANGFNGSVEIISIKPVPQGLIYQNVIAGDWFPTPINTPEYLLATFTATATTPANSLWAYNKTDGYANAVVGSESYVFTEGSNSQDKEIPMVEGDVVNWYVSNIASMTVFYAYNNQLTGTIPSLSTNIKLERFLVYNNQLTGAIPNLSANINLANFQVQANSLTGTIPSLSSNINLTVFYVYKNQLTGTIPDLSSNINLTHFYVYNNQLTGNIPDLSSNINLARFQAYNTQLTGFAGGWPNKAFNFDVSNNALTESAVNQILIDADTSGIATGTTINLTGGANSAPTGLGITAKNSLIANGATVTTN